MRHLTLSGSDALRCENHDPQEFLPADPLTLRAMVDASVHLCDGTVQHNADPDWETFSSDEYWRSNYAEMQAEDQEIIGRVSLFFHKAFDGRDRAQRAIDVGSGTNLYPALLMLPWAEQILLTDLSESNVRWLRRHVMDDDAPWTWQPFWRRMCDFEDYGQIDEPRRHLRRACTGLPGHAGIEQRSVFELREASVQWQLGTMFFVAESITEDPKEFHTAIDVFVGSLQPHSPFAATFMAGSHGYSVDDKPFPALSITPDDVTEQFKKLGVSELSVELLETEKRVREGYTEMIVATGITGS
jgi:hypothetical protein